MVQEGIVLGHKVSKRGLEVDNAKIDIIKNLSPPTDVKVIRSFLGHAGFYRRFIKYFSKIASSLCTLLCKEADFNFTSKCLEAFNRIKKELISAPILQAPNWDHGFEIMCDASDLVLFKDKGLIRKLMLSIMLAKC